ncbi:MULTISPECIES: hypothetical protein [Acetobacter]|jgi:hypothetical protein|uniref:Uncharacterized protein n=1 Tax=Acetobacter lovaniensis TaxID=104100 RepID=A0A841QGD6_9PROT|nr:hypothetical protein [Acetobacter lovaniensis]MBB6457112.1 hypothetical protein [Acetobacter lovaniensis]MCI1697695.1 hypothetical protein [Acetobacter lovaniensis]MCI1795777.1 hypothetical protein [Acetobacter lovaniensis]MCP1239544.1 hypothetical protein [Acetobacter lovaniensis]GBQ63479.1 hypothetical protein AA0474_0298 [Acetobacter lovaniensis NRIC 0474]
MPEEPPNRSGADVQGQPYGGIGPGIGPGPGPGPGIGGGGRGGRAQKRWAQVCMAGVPYGFFSYR